MRVARIIQSKERFIMRCISCWRTKMVHCPMPTPVAPIWLRLIPWHIMNHYFFCIQGFKGRNDGKNKHKHLQNPSFFHLTSQNNSFTITSLNVKVKNNPLKNRFFKQIMTELERGLKLDKTGNRKAWKIKQQITPDMRLYLSNFLKREL